MNDRSVKIDLLTSSSKYRSNVVIYNRIPKTGSTSLMQLPYELCNKLKYNVLLLNITGGPRSYTMSLQDRMAFSWNITGKDIKHSCYMGSAFTLCLLKSKSIDDSLQHGKKSNRLSTTVILHFLTLTNFLSISKPM